MQLQQSSVQPLCPNCNFGTQIPDPRALELMIDCENCGTQYICKVKHQGNKKIYLTAPTTLSEETSKRKGVLSDRDTDFLNKQKKQARISPDAMKQKEAEQIESPKPVKNTQQKVRTPEKVPVKIAAPVQVKPLNPYELKLVESIQEQISHYKEAKRLRSTFFIGFYLLSALGVFVSHYMIKQPAIAMGFCIWSVGAAFNYFLIAGFFNTHENVIFSRTKRLWDQSSIVDKLFFLSLGVGIIGALIQFKLILTALFFWALSIGFGFLMAHAMDHQVRATRFNVVRKLYKAIDNLKYKKYYCNNLRVALCRYTDKYWYELYEYMFGYDETLLVRKELEDEGIALPYKKWRHFLTGWIDERIMAKSQSPSEETIDLKALLQAPSQTSPEKQSQAQSQTQPADKPAQAAIDTSKLKQLLAAMEVNGTKMAEDDFAKKSQLMMTELLHVQQTLLVSRIQAENKGVNLSVPVESLHDNLHANVLKQLPEKKPEQVQLVPKSEKKPSVKESFLNQLLEYIKRSVIPELKVVEKDRPEPKASPLSLDANLTQLICGSMRLIAFALGGVMTVLGYMWLNQNDLLDPSKLLDYFADAGGTKPLKQLTKMDLPGFLLPWAPQVLSGLHAGFAGLILICASVISPVYRTIILLILAGIVLTVGTSMSWY